MLNGQKQKGFTLIELLIVIAILVILMAAILMVINPGKLLKKSRDSRRVAEITEVNKAIAASVADQKLTLGPNAQAERTSLSPAAFTVGGAGWVGGSAVAPITWTGTLSSFTNTLPRDPTNTGNLCYRYTANASGEWEIAGVLESSDNQNVVINDGGNEGDATSCTTTSMEATGGDIDCMYEVGPGAATL